MGHWRGQRGLCCLKDLGIPITNTPNMFGGEVADIAIGYEDISNNATKDFLLSV